MITISHSATDGTLVLGDPRPHHQVVKAAGLRFSRRIGDSGGWYLPHSRDKAPRRQLIDRLADQLRGVGFEVTVDVDDTSRPTAERETDRAERLTERQDGLDAKSAKAAAKADTLIGRADAIADMIPFGQPILVGHHSERRHRKDLARIDATYRQGFDAHKEAVNSARHAESSRATQQHHESGPATVRRIQRLEADRRAIERKLAPCPISGRPMKAEAEGRTLDCPLCWTKITVTDRVVPEHGGAAGDWRDKLTARIEDLDEQLAYWRAHLDELQASGEWTELGPGDFAKGDRVTANGLPATVERVNPKSLTVRADVMPQFTHTCPYDKIRKVQT